jgi:hypothetical protein
LIRSDTRSKFAQRYRDEATSVVMIDPDLQKLFSDSDTGNHPEPAGQARQCVGSVIADTIIAEAD